MSESMTIDEERTRFFAAMGEAINQWSWVEVHLCEVFFHLIGSREFATLAASFHSVMFRAKLDMVDAAAALVLAEDDKSEWNKIRNHLRRASQRRNDLAHLTVYANLSMPTGKAVYLASALTDYRIQHAGPSKPLYSYERVLAMCRKFRKLEARLIEFRKRIHPS